MFFSAFVSIVSAQTDTPQVFECSWNQAIDCIIEKFNDKKSVSGNIDADKTFQIIFEKAEIKAVLINKAQQKINECTTKISNFFKVQATIEDIKNDKIPDISYMECEEKKMQSPKPVEKTPLKIANLRILDAKTLLLTFNEKIQYKTVQVRLVENKESQNISVKDYLPFTDDKTIKILLGNPLKSDTEYTLTINTALSENQVAIKSGIDSIRVFTTEKNLKWAEKIEQLKIETPKEDIISEKTPEMTPTDSQENRPQEVTSETPKTQDETEKKDEEAQKEDLPQTGPNAIFFLVLIAFISAGLLAIRRKHI